MAKIRESQYVLWNVARLVLRLTSLRTYAHHVINCIYVVAVIKSSLLETLGITELRRRHLLELAGIPLLPHEP